MSSMESVPVHRIRRANDRPVRPEGDFVLYWMCAFRRPFSNFSLQRAVEWALKLGKPLVILEALRCDYPWASDRLHRFILDGMVENGRYFEKTSVLYYPYVETAKGGAKGLVEALAHEACIVVGDDFPAFFLPHMLQAASRKVSVRLEAVDSNGLLPLRAATGDFPSAYSFRRFLQKVLPPHLLEFPVGEPLLHLELPRLKELPAAILKRWPPASAEILDGGEAGLAGLPIDHSVRAVEQKGGWRTARAYLNRFVETRLENYSEHRSEPEVEATSELSAYLHFGHISSHAVANAVMEREDWSPDRLGPDARGKRTGWWGMGGSAQAFMDQLVTWRELGYNFCAFRDDADRFESLPGWAVETLEKHSRDPRPYLYDLQELEQAQTHDPLWNAAQRQLLREGKMHNYMRMLWGKKILEWSPDPREALRVMVELNNRHALDGRDPNSGSGIFWCLGRYDRPWGPQRPIFGKIRYMSSENTARKFSTGEYLKRYGPG